MSSINTQNILSPVQANLVDKRTVHEDAQALYSSENAFNFDWFILSDSSASTGHIAKSPTSAISPINTMSQLDSTTALRSTMESRVERIIHFILPQA